MFLKDLFVFFAFLELGLATDLIARLAQGRPSFISSTRASLMQSTTKNVAAAQAVPIQASDTTLLILSPLDTLRKMRTIATDTNKGTKLHRTNQSKFTSGNVYRCKIRT